MKLTNKSIGALFIASVALSSCVDESLLPFDGYTKPGSLADYEYLKEYDVLKSYVNREAHPIFKVGAAIEADDYMKEGSVAYRVVNTNFDEVVAGNAMKMGMVVSDKGEFNYGTVSSFVAAAEAGGMSVYGHTLAWHSQQPSKWLNKLIADRPKPIDPNAGTVIEEEVVTVVTYNDGPFPFYPMGSEPPVINGAIHFEPTGDWSQFFITNAIALEPGDYVAILNIKSSKAGNIKLTAQNGWSDQQLIDGTVALTGGDWEDVAVPFKGITCEPSANYDFILKPETFDAVLDIKSLTIVRLKEVAAPSIITEDKEVATITYNDGPFPFYPMGSEPPVINGAIHFEPTGDWSQFFITNAIALEPGDYSAILNIKSSKAGDIKLTAQNGWSDQQLIDGTVALTGGDWEDVEVKFKGITCEPSANYDFILKPETFDAVLDIKSLKIVQHITKVVGNDAPVYKDVWTNEIANSEMDPAQPMDCFVARDKETNDEPAKAIAGGGPDGKNCLVIKGKTETKNSWDTQFFVYTPNKKWEAGEKYRFHMWYKASKNIGTDTQVHGEPGGYIHWQMLTPNPSFTTEWQEMTWEGNIPGEGGGNQQTIAFNLNKNRTASEDAAETVEEIDYYFSDITWESCTQIEVPKTEEQFIKKRCIIVKAGEKVDEAWDNQFWIKAKQPFHSGDSYEFKVEVRADNAASPGTQIHGEPGAYLHWSAVGNVSFTEDWDTYTAKGTIPAEGDGGQSIAFNLNDFADANNYYFGNISFKINGEEMVINGDLKSDDTSSFFEKLNRGATVNSTIVDGYTIVTEIKSTIPLTDEEKRDTLTWAMNKWITGMMEATEGKVKSWDLVNELISGDGGIVHSLDNMEDPGIFLWQNYFDDVEYVPTVERLTREAYAAIEGANPADLKLFINDYNLEWQTAKVDGLCEWINRWEEAGAKIDGVGTQMHISYCRDAADQENLKKGITYMLTKLAATGKLVRISELDMGIVEKMFGEPITKGITLADEKAMSDFYQWIVEEYFRIVPPNQQYGICQWCLTDAPASSGWRASEPVGLWYLDWTRKPAYAGWAEGLQK